MQKVVRADQKGRHYSTSFAPLAGEGWKDKTDREPGAGGTVGLARRRGGGFEGQVALRAYAWCRVARLRASHVNVPSPLGMREAS